MAQQVVKRYRIVPQKIVDILPPNSGKYLLTLISSTNS